MRELCVSLGQPRSASDGCRRYLPIRVTFDTRNVILNLDIQDSWDDDAKDLWKRNKEAVEVGLLAELGVIDAEQKLDNYRAMGPAPWSVVFAHSVLLSQVRNSFAHGDFYPALVGACSLGERLLHELVLALRHDYVNHPRTTKRVRSGRLSNEWASLINVLHDWGVFDEGVATTYRGLEKMRHESVHFDPAVNAGGRDAALAALLALQEIVEAVFEPHGGPPRYIADTVGHSFIALGAEEEPLIKRIFLPNCALVSPVHRLERTMSTPADWTVYDDAEHPCGELSDEERGRAVARG